MAIQYMLEVSRYDTSTTEEQHLGTIVCKRDAINQATDDCVKATDLAEEIQELIDGEV